MQDPLILSSIIVCIVLSVHFRLGNIHFNLLIYFFPIQFLSSVYFSKYNQKKKKIFQNLKLNSIHSLSYVLYFTI